MPELSPENCKIGGVDAGGGGGAVGGRGGVTGGQVLLVAVPAVPAALLGLAAFAPGFRADLGLTEPHLDAAVLLPLLLVALGAGGAWWLWRRDPAGDPAAALGPLRPAFAHAFWLDEVQHALIVRPFRALAAVARGADERVVDAAVTGTGRGTARLGARLAVAHRSGLPRAAVAVLAGALLLGLAAAVIGGAA